MISIRILLACLSGLAAAVVPALGAEPPLLIGFVRSSAGSIDTAPSYLAGGFGKLLDGGRPDKDSAGAVVSEARLAVDWESALGWGLFVHGVAREDAATQGLSAGSGLLEAFAERRLETESGHQWTLRAGQFFLPTSRENVGPLWTSPYTLTLSALNSWIAEEIRPIGVDVAWGHTFPNQHRLKLAGTVFGGNDTAGALLAWRGFSFNDRPTPTGRFMPLPPFQGRAELFPGQSQEGTRAFGSDLDGRPGYAGRARWTAPGDRAMAQVSAFLNQGDRGLHGAEYAWDTDFYCFSAETDLPAGLRLLGEWGSGTSLMGFAPPGGRSAARVDISFNTYYLMVTREWGVLRATARYDDFQVRDRDSTPLDDNRENGHAWTFALIARLGEHWRAGLEALDLKAVRPAARLAGTPPIDGDSLRAELRFEF
ncbi:MAG TPA: hypothetical protein VF173_21215 [Thermoanaerobaculia bacterium]|nr:hypothetical protein [Thermoanaerobaculia bacterium]